MKKVVNPDFLGNVNCIEEGLNFLVPNTWWRNFYSKNENIKCFRELRLVQSYPLDDLFEAGIIQQPSKAYKQNFHSIQKQTERTLKSIKQKLKKVQFFQGSRSDPKRQKIPCQWLWEKEERSEQREKFNNSVSTTECDLLLLSPQIKSDLAELFQLRSQDWTVVSPELYKLIWNQETQDRRSEAKTMVAIPVLLGKNHKLYVNETIDYRNRKFVELFIKNCSGFNFCFIGFVDGDITFKSLIKWLDEGMFKLVADRKSSFEIKHKNMVIGLTQKEEVIAYSFFDDIYNDQLNWGEFSTLEDTIISTSVLQKLIVFVGSNTDQSMEEKQQTEGDQLFGKSSKKRLRNNSIGIGEGASSLMLRAEARPIILQGEGSYPRVPPVQIIQVHSSTQEETPSDLGPREVVLPKPDNKFTSSRIHFSIWKESLNSQNLVRLAHIRSSIPKILIPFREQANIVIKDEGKKIVFPKQANELAKDQFGILFQKDYFEPIIQEEGAIPANVKKQLQMLASEMLGLKITERSQGQKVAIDMAKDNSECEDRTCKNDFMDEFDWEESRQF